ncbi:opioid growth factor receptor-like protein 1 [Limulus polyphemus]|uniref:Opioid growth factor receptor-like protein 1 n=1 Tax=Limulus polyphemus TaxID=6850 RepID=A0ABM1B3W8_LIMPO|nr:opioid growth factor receptor-like protein 1 [Limulus polyphemus]
MNSGGHALQLHEAKAIKSDPQSKKRVFRAYTMMLDFYGIEFTNQYTGELKRGKNWEEKAKSLNKYIYNYLRITQILKFLGEVGFEELKCPLVEFLLLECLKERSLSYANIALKDYWVHVLRNEADRTYILRLLAHYWPDRDKLER